MNNITEIKAHFYKNHGMLLTTADAIYVQEVTEELDKFFVEESKPKAEENILEEIPFAKILILVIFLMLSKANFVFNPIIVSENAKEIHNIK